MKLEENPVPEGEGMNRMKGYKNAYLRKQYWQLPDEKRAEVKRAAKNYFAACVREKVDYSPEEDSEFFREVITDLRDDLFTQEEYDAYK